MITPLNTFGFQIGMEVVTKQEITKMVPFRGELVEECKRRFFFIGTFEQEEDGTIYAVDRNEEYRVSLIDLKRTVAGISCLSGIYTVDLNVYYTAIWNTPFINKQKSA